MARARAAKAAGARRAAAKKPRTETRGAGESAAAPPSDDTALDRAGRIRWGALAVLSVVAGAMQAGARGVFFGKNIWQSPDPTRMTTAISRVIHDNARPEEAVQALGVG